jgi:endonuclease/exonuclease/phosphatase family metal-dependent hydrolase
MMRTLLLLALVLTDAAPAPFHLMTFNIRYGTAPDGANAWPLRAGLVVATVRHAAPDVLALQEALRLQLDLLRDSLPAYAELGVGRDDGKEAGEYAAILYRRDRLAVDTTGTFWLSDTPTVPGSMSWGNRITRICTWARFHDRATGTAFTVFNVHLDHESQNSRERSVALVLERAPRLAAGTPVVLLGDFNAGEDNPAAAAVRQAGFVEAYRVMRPNDVWAGTFGGFQGDSTGPMIDHIFLRGAWRVHASDILRRRGTTRDASDHFPVVATVELEGPGVRGER